MQNIGIWHYFNPNDRGSYPVVRTRIQVKYANGVEDEGEWVEFFSQVKSLVESPITGWRYVKTCRYTSDSPTIVLTPWSASGRHDCSYAEQHARLKRS
jgi:hypothetical protein